MKVQKKRIETPKKPVVVMTIRPDSRNTYSITRIPVKDSFDRVKLTHKSKGKGVVNTWVFDCASELERVAKMFHAMIEMKKNL